MAVVTSHNRSCMLVGMVLTVAFALASASSAADVVCLLSSAFPPVPSPSISHLVSEISLQLLVGISQKHPYFSPLLSPLSSFLYLFVGGAANMYA